MSFISRRSKSQSFRKRDSEFKKEALESGNEEVITDWKIGNSVRERLLNNVKSSRTLHRNKLVGNVTEKDIKIEEISTVDTVLNLEKKTHPITSIHGSEYEVRRPQGYGEITYTDEYLDTLMRSQKSIPTSTKWKNQVIEGEDDQFEYDEESISAAREFREKKRAEANKSNTSRELFISFSQNDSKKFVPGVKHNVESRLPTEEHEEDIDNLDEYKENKIAFIPDTPDEAKMKLRGQIQAVLEVEQPELEEAIDEIDDSWEKSQVRRGIKPLQYRGSISNEEIARKTWKNPSQAIIRTPENELTELENLINKMELDFSLSDEKVETLKFDLEKSKQLLSEYEKDLLTLSNTYEFFQELNCYIIDLSEFIYDKLARVERLTQLWTETIKNESTISLKSRKKLMDLCKNIITNPNTTQDINTAFIRLRNYENNTINNDALRDITLEREVLTNEHRLLFKDAKKKFRSSSEVRQKFESWAVNYPDLYSKASCAYCIPDVYEIYVKYELIGYTYNDFLDIRTMNWFSQLISSPINTINVTGNNMVSKIIIKYVIPWFKSLIGFWDLYNCKQTTYLSQVFSQIVEIISFNDPAYTETKCLILDHILETVQTQVENASKQLEKISRNVTNEALFPFVSFWMERIDDLKNNILIWNSTIDKQVLEYIIENKVKPTLTITTN